MWRTCKHHLIVVNQVDFYQRLPPLLLLLVVHLEVLAPVLVPVLSIVLCSITCRMLPLPLGLALATCLLLILHRWLLLPMLNQCRPMLNQCRRKLPGTGNGLCLCLPLQQHLKVCLQLCHLCMPRRRQLCLRFEYPLFTVYSNSRQGKHTGSG